MSDADLGCFASVVMIHLRFMRHTKKAVETSNGKPTLILPMTVKGYGLGEYMESLRILRTMSKNLIQKLLSISKTDLMYLLQKRC